MRSRSKLLWVVVAAIGAAALGCKDAGVRTYLNDKLTPWLAQVSDAVCNIEPHVAGLPPADRICPNGKGGPGDRTTPPPPPPKP